MPQTKTPPLSEELQQKIEEIAREQHREPADVLDEAVRQYLERENWVNFVRENERKARANDIVEGDVNRLIGEVRQEKRRR